MAQTQGTIVQSIGAVIDIEFAREGMPKVYDALTLEDSGENTSYLASLVTYPVRKKCQISVPADFTADSGAAACGADSGCGSSCSRAAVTA